MAETIVLDPSEVAVSRTQTDITPWVAGEGIDWGDAEIAAYMADQSRGSFPVDFRVPNRMITVPLVLKATGGTTFAQIRTRIQAKAALIQQEGGWLRRVSSGGGTVFADIVNATLKLSGGWEQAHKNFDIDASLVLEAHPDFYGAETTLVDHTTTTATELVFTETGIQGNFPARCRIVVDEDDNDRQLGLLWGIRSRTYSVASTAGLAYNAGSLTPLDTAAIFATTAIRHPSVPTTWTPVLSTDTLASGAMTHSGTYRVWAQCACADSTDRSFDVRLLWDVGDMSEPAQNTAVRLPGPVNKYDLDLGEIRIVAAPTGTHRWQGQIQAKVAAATAALDVYKMWLVPVDDGYGVLRAPLTSAAWFNTYTARDEFNQTAGTITGQTVQVGGGAWSTYANGTSPTDFSVNATDHTLTKSATNEAWRVAIAGTASMTNTLVQADFNWSGIDLTNAGGFSLVARWVDNNNFIAASFHPHTGGMTVYRISSFNSGAVTSTILANWAPTQPWTVDTWYTGRLYVDSQGKVAAWFGLQGGAFGRPPLVGLSPDAATGGALASGRVGFFESYPSLVASTRTYDNFVAFPPTQDAVLHPNQSAELRWDGMFRGDATGTSYGPVPWVTGDLPRLPPAGVEARTCELFIKASRGDFDQLPDTHVDDISARVSYRPCWLFVP